MPGHADEKIMGGALFEAARLAQTFPCTLHGVCRAALRARVLASDAAVLSPVVACYSESGGVVTARSLPHIHVDVGCDTHGFVECSVNSEKNSRLCGLHARRTHFRTIRNHDGRAGPA